MSKKTKTRYFIIHKPYGMMSQFSHQEGKTCLADLDYNFPRDVYPVGRLDHDSEGLLLLTNDKTINNTLLSPENEHSKTYLTQVEGLPNKKALTQLMAGVEISAKGVTHQTAIAKAKLTNQPEWIKERSTPIKQGLETSWVELIITEGKNRQVRKMTAAVGHPTLRLIRLSIENVSVVGLESGQVMELSKNTALKKLNLNLD